MNDQEIERLLQFVFEDEASTTAVPDDCQHLLHAYVETELAGGNAAIQFPSVQACLETMPAFREAYEELKAFLEMEHAGLLADPGTLPGLDEAFLRELLEEETAVSSPPHPSPLQYFNKLGHLVIQLGHYLRQAAAEKRPTSLSPTERLAGVLLSASGGTSFLFTEAADHEIEVKLLSVDKQQGAGSLEVTVNILSRGGWPNLGETAVSLHTPTSPSRTLLTDPAGRVLFRNVSLADLNDLTIEIAPSA